MQKLWGTRIGINRVWQGTSPRVLLFEPETVEVSFVPGLGFHFVTYPISVLTLQPILNSQKFVNKSHDYDYLHPWLGTGLLTSTDRKWHSRRKVNYKQRRRGGTEQCKLIRFSLQILTPAFHFKILDDFIDVFNEQSAVLARKLAVEVGSEAFNLFPYVTLCTLDIVCGESHAVQGEVSPRYQLTVC